MSAGPLDEFHYKGSLLIDTYGFEELGINPRTYCVIQDEDGVLYFGCDQLVVADGERWKTYKINDDYGIHSLDFSPDGKLWAAGAYEMGWFERTPTGDWSYHSLLTELPEALQRLDYIWNVYATPMGAIFTSTSKIIIWDGSTFRWWDYSHLDSKIYVMRTGGKIYLQNEKIGMLQIEPTGPVPATLASPPDGSKLLWADTIDGQLIYVTRVGMGIVENDQITYPDPNLSEFINKFLIRSVEHLPDGSLAVTSRLGGVGIVGRDLHLKGIIDSNSGLPTNKIRGAIVDRDGSLWITTQAAISRISLASGITVFDQRHGLASSAMRDLTFLGKTPIILNSDGAATLTKGLAKPIPSISRDKGSYWDLKSTANGLLVSATSGLYHVPHGLELMTPVFKSTNGSVREVYPAETPDMLFAEIDDRIVRFSPTQGNPQDIFTHLPDEAIAIHLDQKKRLWVGTESKGLLVAQLGGEEPVDAFPTQPDYGYPVSSGRVWVTHVESLVVAISSEGIHWLDPASDRYRLVPNSPLGLPENYAKPDSQGRTWVAFEPLHPKMPPRVGQLERTEHGVRWIPRSIEGIGHVGHLQTLHVENTAEGDVLWVSGSEAILRVEHPEENIATPPTKPLINAVVRGESGSPDHSITGELPYTTKRLHLEFSSVEYRMRDTLRYQTMLVGVDEDWSAPTNSAEQDLTGLREGDYTFKVRLIADTGLASEPAELTFSIATPWWRTPYAYGSYIGVLGLIIAGLYRLRIRSIQQRAVELEQTVDRRTEELVKANAAKTEFVASMSHEIRNPMNGIIGTTHALEETPLNEEQRDLVATLRNCASFLGSLVEDVLDFSSIEAGAFTVEQQPCSPQEILETVSTMLSAPAVEAGAHFEIEVDPTLPDRLLGDASRIQQIVVNYATNALKFSGGGRVRLSAYTDNDNVAFAVTDNGPGISTEEQAVLFTRFSRLKTARQAGISGTGLGLAVCRALAERMNGSVGVASAPRRGATFFLRVPLVAATAEDLVAKPSVPSMEGAHALVVEDIEYNARALGVMLRQLGFTVDFATNGASALKQLSSQSYHTVFLDYDLPDMSGLDVARHLRARESEATHTLVIATTAYSTVEDKKACLDAGMDVFLGKPITPEKLQAVLAGIPTTSLPSPSVHLPADESSGINLRMLEYLAGDSPGGLQREIKRYLDTLTVIQREVNDALIIRDRSALAKGAHHMLSHTRMIEATALTAITEEMETEADYAEARRLDELGDEMSAAITQLRKTLVHHPQAQTTA